MNRTDESMIPARPAHSGDFPIYFSLLAKNTQEKVRKGGFEPPRLFGHYPLKIACLPVPPLPHVLRSRFLVQMCFIHRKRDNCVSAHLLDHIFQWSRCCARECPCLDVFDFTSMYQAVNLLHPVFVPASVPPGSTPAAGATPVLSALASAALARRFPPVPSSCRNPCMTG